MKTTPLKVRLDGDACLRVKSELVDDVGVSERILIDSMIRTMYASEGIGLAAPQVGINKRIFVFDVGEGSNVVINPKILKKEGSIVCEEGCLSVPAIVVNIERAETIHVSYFDENSKVVNNTLREMAARVFLHENDHLDGKLIIDYASAKEKDEFKERLQNIHEIQKEQ